MNDKLVGDYAPTNAAKKIASVRMFQNTSLFEKVQNLPRHITR